jgi:hypothetical protein
MLSNTTVGREEFKGPAAGISKTAVGEQGTLDLDITCASARHRQYQPECQVEYQRLDSEGETVSKDGCDDAAAAAAAAACVSRHHGENELQSMCSHQNDDYMRCPCSMICTSSLDEKPYQHQQNEKSSEHEQAAAQDAYPQSIGRMPRLVLLRRIWNGITQFHTR